MSLPKWVEELKDSHGLCEDDSRLLWEALSVAWEALEKIEKGNWNFGNLSPGKTVMNYAEETLRRIEEMGK